jgi:hypothetical protein
MNIEYEEKPKNSKFQDIIMLLLKLDLNHVGWFVQLKHSFVYSINLLVQMYCC